MTQIKRGTTPTIRVRMDGIKPEDVRSVEFLFKPIVTDAGYELFHKVYPGDVTYDETEALWLLPLTEEEIQRRVDERIAAEGASDEQDIPTEEALDIILGGASV